MILYSANHVKEERYLYLTISAFINTQDNIDCNLKVVSIKNLDEDQKQELLEEKWIRLDE